MNKIKEKIKEIWQREYQIKYLFLVFLLLLVLLGVGACSISEYKINSVYKEKQAACEHDWRELYAYDSGYVDIYCPKCQLQKEYLRVQDWTRIQIDQEYNKAK